MEKQKKITPKGSQAAGQSFQKLYKKLDAEDNPVLVIVKTKQ
jgi:fatty acid-binding protein DegV